MRLPAAFAAALFTICLPELRADFADGVESPWRASSLDFPAAAARTSRATWPGPFPVEALTVKDGDTVELRFRDGPCGRAPCPSQIVALRVLGIDAPEAHRCGKKLWGRSGGASCAACLDELALGQQARQFTSRMLRDAPLRASGLRPDKYGGRLVGELEALRDGRWTRLSTALLQAGLAVPYDGGRKVKPWCKR